MPNFQASLIDNTGAVGITLNVAKTGLIVTDFSNYALSDEEGHLQYNFADFREFHIRTPKGSIDIVDTGSPLILNLSWLRLRLCLLHLCYLLMRLES